MDKGDSIYMIGALLIHGFTGSPEEVEPLAQELKQIGFHVVAPVLKGHGGDLRELSTCTWIDWIASAEKSLQKLLQQHAKVIIIGFSMGGLIAAHLASRYPVERLILLSPAIYAPNFRQMVIDLRDSILKRDMRSFERIGEYMYKFFATPKKTFWHFRRLVKNVRSDLPKVCVPTLIIHGTMDDVVHPRSAKYIYDAISSQEKKLYYLPRSKHIICHDREAEQVKYLVRTFLPQLSIRKI